MEKHDCEGRGKAGSELSEVVRRCPFCGGEAKRRQGACSEIDGYAEHVFYRCQSCGVERGAGGITRGYGYADNSTVEERALAAWNQRAEA